MAKLIQPANTNGNQEVLNDFTPVPPNDYKVIIAKSEFKKTKAGTGHYLSLQMKIIEGEYKGRTLFENLNLDNPNPTAVEIANKALNTICKACNKVGVQDSEELHGIPMIATVSITEATKTKPASNSIKFYAPVEGAAPVETTAAPSIPAQEAATKKSAPTGKLPWETDDDIPF